MRGGYDRSGFGAVPKFRMEFTGVFFAYWLSPKVLGNVATVVKKSQKVFKKNDDC